MKKLTRYSQKVLLKKLLKEEKMNTQDLKPQELVMTAVYDSKVKEFGQIMCAKTIEEAIRSFSAACKQENHQFRQFANDYTLYKIGTYIPELGKIINCDNIQISSATDFTNVTN